MWTPKSSIPWRKTTLCEDNRGGKDHSRWYNKFNVYTNKKQLKVLKSLLNSEPKLIKLPFIENFIIYKIKYLTQIWCNLPVNILSVDLVQEELFQGNYFDSCILFSTSFAINKRDYFVSRTGIRRTTYQKHLQGPYYFQLYWDTSCHSSCDTFFISMRFSPL